MKNPVSGKTDNFRIQDKAVSTNELDDYIHIASPGVLMAVMAMLIVVGAIIVWGFTGTLPVKESVTGVTLDLANDFGDPENNDADVDNKSNIYILCFLDANLFTPEKFSKIDRNVVLEMPDHSVFTGTIEQITVSPLSREQARTSFHAFDWFEEKCVNQDYSWGVKIRPDEDISDYIYTLTNVTFVTDQVRPIHCLGR